MFGSFLSVFGAKIGDMFGGGIFSTIGRYAGRLFGNYIDSNDIDSEDRYQTYGKVLNNLNIQSSAYGKPIPLVFGKAKIAGNIIWAKPIEEVLCENTDYKYLAKAAKEIFTHK